MPGTLVEIGLKLLFDFGSHVSMWLGPPSSQNRMTEFAFPAGWVLAAAARYSLRVTPRKPSDPTLRKLRRQSITPPLMILREFAGADQSPDKFAQSGLAVSLLGQNAFQLAHLGIQRRSAESSQIELFKDLFIACTRFQQLCKAAVR